MTKLRKMICQKCGKEETVLQVFKGKWVCMDCWNSLVKYRDYTYYKKLRENKTLKKELREKHGFSLAFHLLKHPSQLKNMRNRYEQ